MTDVLTPEDFEPLLDRAFSAGEGAPPLTLAQIDRGPQGREGSRPLFNLIFHGPRGLVLPEGLYALRADGGPSFDLYLMPIQTHAADRQDYQAAFN